MRINLCNFCFNDLFCVLVLRARIANPRYRDGNIYTLAEDISNMKNKPNTPKATDFNLFDVTISDRRLQPDLTIKTK